MVMDNKKFLIFDFFGVISSEVFNIWLDRHGLNSRYNEAIQFTRRADRGEISYREEISALAKISGQDPEVLHAEWMSILKINQHIVDFIQSNRNKYHFALLSNSSADFVRPILNKYQLEGLFEHVFISSELRLVKPNQDIFWTAVQSLQTTPENCIMIDDKAENIEGAKSIGMGGIVYSIPKE